MVIAGILSACSLQKQLTSDFSNAKKHTYFTGLMVYNPQSKQTLISYNADKYFTPASTVKLFTLYTSLRYLPDSIATVSYLETPDTLYIKPLADPSFLHDSLPNTTYQFLKNQTKPIAVIPDTLEDFIYGEGWQWDDYPFYYMPEKSLFPIYGNYALLNGDKITPHYFQSSLTPSDISEPTRDFFENKFTYNPQKKFTGRKIPFRTSFALSVQLLADTLHQNISISKSSGLKEFKPYVSTPVRPLYDRLMNESENFMAEHLFLQVAKTHTGKYQVQNAITLALDSLFTDVPQQPKWVDASGLSRYNLFTPHDMVYLLEKMLDEYGTDFTLDLMPKNGAGGRLQKWYPFDQTYLYAKTGSVSNNHNICGYLITEKGTLLIFSYMNNNYMEKSSDVRQKMNQVLQQIYHTY